MNNLMMNWTILILSAHIRKKSGWKMGGKCLAVSAAGSLLETFALVLARSTTVLLLFSVFFVMPGMVILVHGKEGGRRFAENLILVFGVTILLGGMMQVLDQWFGIGESSFLMAVCGLLLGDLVLHWLYGSIRMEQKMLWVDMEKGTRSVRCRGLLDTGNMLCVPGTNDAVHIVSERIFFQLGLSGEDTVGMIGFQSLGNSAGRLPIYRIDSLTVRCRCGKKSGEICTKQPVVAKAAPGLLEKKPYQVILHESCSGEWNF